MMQFVKKHGSSCVHGQQFICSATLHDSCPGERYGKCSGQIVSYRYCFPHFLAILNIYSAKNTVIPIHYLCKTADLAQW